VWVGARQAGVQQGRATFCRAQQAAGAPAFAAVDCGNGTAVMEAAGAAVYLALEVNLVKVGPATRLHDGGSMAERGEGV
jgi:hypothetical protein